MERGDFVAEDGTVLGRHDGIARYTVGMRRGIGIAAAEKLYVKAINADTNSITLATINNMYTNAVYIDDIYWISGRCVDMPFTAPVKLRHTRREDMATVRADDGGGLELLFDSPVRIPAPGQYAAIYSGDTLICSGVIR